MLKFLLISLSFIQIANADYLKETVYHLSSKKFSGRAAGTNGGQLATDFIEAEFKRFGLAPFGRGFKQSFTIFTKMTKGKNNFLKNKDIPATFQPLSFSNNGSLKNADVVFVGFGISLPQGESFQYDDYKNVNVEGKVVIAFTGDPGIGNQQSPFRNPKYITYRSLYYKLKNAIAHKAKGLILIQDPLTLATQTNEQDPHFHSRDGGGSRFNIIAGTTKNTWANKVFKSSGMNKTTLELQQQIAKTQQTSSFQLKETYIDLSVELKKETGRVSNVIGVLEGSDPKLKKEVVILGAHFDHLGFGGQSSMDPRHTNTIHYGADDNASGTALVLNLAKSLKNKKLKRTVIFALFNAEEIGLLGSDHFVSAWSRYQSTFGNIKYMLNFDMVGRFQKEVAVMGTGSSKEWDHYLKDVIKQLEANANQKLLIPLALQKTHVGSSDHASFIQNKIPSIFFSTGAHEDYHRSTDTPDKVNYKALSNIGFFVENLISYMDTPRKLTFDPSSLNSSDNSGRDRGYGAHLGCVPKFGQSSDIQGVACTRSSTGSPAEIAGIIAGDILTQVGEIEIKSLYDLAFALKYYRAGDQVEISWKRKDKTLSKKVILTKKAPRH